MIQEANASGITLSESQLCEVVSKKYFFGYITSFLESTWRVSVTRGHKVY